MALIINRTGLQVGQWIQFHTTKDLSQASEPQQAIYQENQRYLVFSREDALFDACRCNVMDIDGKSFDYCARMFSLGYTNLVSDGEIRVVSKESVETIHGAEKVQAVYEAAKKRIDELSGYFTKYPAQILGTFSCEASQARQLSSGFNPIEALPSSVVYNIISPLDICLFLTVYLRKNYNFRG